MCTTGSSPPPALDTASLDVAVAIRGHLLTSDSRFVMRGRSSC
jgi:hypothetical protein